MTTRNEMFGMLAMVSVVVSCGGPSVNTVALPPDTGGVLACSCPSRTDFWLHTSRAQGPECHYNGSDWNCPNLRALFTTGGSHPTVIVQPNAQAIVSDGRSRMLRVNRTGQMVAEYTLPSWVTPDAGSMVVGSADGTVFAVGPANIFPLGSFRQGSRWDGTTWHDVPMPDASTQMRDAVALDGGRLIAFADNNSEGNFGLYDGQWHMRQVGFTQRPQARVVGSEVWIITPGGAGMQGVEVAVLVYSGGQWSERQLSWRGDYYFNGSIGQLVTFRGGLGISAERLDGRGGGDTRREFTVHPIEGTTLGGPVLVGRIGNFCPGGLNCGGPIPGFALDDGTFGYFWTDGVYLNANP